MIDHVAIRCADFKVSVAFYAAALAPLGFRQIVNGDGMAAFGNEFPQFWVIAGPATERAHVAFMAAERSAVDAFHAAAVSAGGRNNGAPGLRAHYNPTYYAAFAFDPDGNNVEAVCHNPE